jgi:hypothetical protein
MEVGPLFPGLVFVPFSPSHDEISATHILWGKGQTDKLCFGASLRKTLI